MTSVPWLLLRPYASRFALLLLVITVGAAAEAVGLILLAGMLNVFLGDARNVPSWSLLESVYEYARVSPRTFLFLMIATYIGKSFLAIAGTYGSFSLALRITDDWRKQLVRAYLRAPLTRLDSPHGSMLQVAVEEPGSAALGLGAAGLLVQNLFATLTVYVVLLYVSWVVTLGLTVLAAVGALLVWGISRSSIRVGHERFVAYTEGYAYIAEMFGAIKQLRTFALEQKAEGDAGTHLARMRRVQLKINMISAAPRLLIELLFLCGLAVTILILLPRMGEATVVSALGLAVVATVRLLPTFASSASTWVQVQQALPAMMNVSRELARLEAAGREQPSSSAARPAPPRCHLSIHDVRFTYPDREPALQGVDLEVEPGAFVALVGPSGSGKSTLIDLICGFHQPDSGHILVDGIDLRDISLTSWRRQLGVVLQDSVLFSGTIRENLCLLRPDCGEAALRDAIAMVGAEPFIRELPEGLETRIGERGLRLSGGQRQRLALARSFLAQPRILILDEAMSALDLDAEEILMNTLNARRGEMGMIVVAHRLSAIRKADEIVVLDRGRIVERGRHESLFARGGVYGSMWRAASVGVH